MQIKDYIKDRVVKRSSIAQDIVSGRLSEADVEALISDHSITSGFIGKGFSDRRPQSEWNANYLKELSYVSVAGPFNEEYLRYLYTVTQYVNNQKSTNVKIQKIKIGIGVLILILVIGTGIYFIIQK